MDAEQIIKQYDSLKAKRGHWEQHWQEISERVLPRSSTFNQKEAQGTKRTEKIFDATACLALERFAAAMESMLTPRAQTWHQLKATNPLVQQDRDAQLWLEEVNRILFNHRYQTRSNFSSQKHEDYMQLGAFGTGTMFIDELPQGGIRYRSIHLAESFLAENHQGIVDTYYRKFPITAHAAMSNPRWEGKLPDRITKSKNPHQEEFEFIHCVKPRADYDPQRSDGLGMPWASYYLSVEGRQILSEGGYRSFPYSISRYVTAARETYGRSPAMTVLPDIKMLNEMSKTDIRAVHKLVDPPLLLHNDGILGGGLSSVDMRPNGLNYGGVNADGRQLIQPFQSGARVDIADEKMEQRRRTINDAFLVTLFQILVENPRMTATEAMLRAQEKGALLSPAMGRQQSECLGPMIERELDILQNQGALPPMPDVLIEARGEYEIVYDSPLSRMQRAEEVTGIARTLEMITPLAQFDPKVLVNFDPQEIVRITAEVNGVPVKALRSREEVAAILDQMQAQEEAAQLASIAQPAATAVKDVAQAQALMNEQQGTG